MKRILDILLSISLLVILFPLLLLIAAMVKIDSPGPVVFKQKRVGKDKKKFTIYKFRTMVDRRADEIDQYVEGVFGSGDQRITRVGRLLRATSLDELLQLINIMFGDMSFVGPRPILPEQLEVVPGMYMCRFDVRPGLTGLAQVNGRRSLGWLHQLKYDKEYAGSLSLWVDVLIVLRTIKVVLGRSGVYSDGGLNWREYRDHINKKGGKDNG